MVDISPSTKVKEKNYLLAIACAKKREWGGA
jgi:hypothetical protein